MPRKASLKASAVCVFSAATKPYMNFSAVRYSTLPFGAGIAGPCHGLQQMCLAQAHARMNVERVEHHGIARDGPRRPDARQHAPACSTCRAQSWRMSGAGRAASRRRAARHQVKVDWAVNSHNPNFART